MTQVEDQPRTVAEPVADPERCADRLYHELLAPEETQNVRTRIRALAEKAVAPHAAKIANGDERTDGFPRHVFDDLAAAGLYGIPFPADVGGAGLSNPATAAAAAIEELAYYSSSVAAVFDVHCLLAGTALNQGTETQRQRWLRKVVDGSAVGAFATTEPDASSDLSPQTVQTAATRTGSGWVLNGHKRWISNSPVAGFIVTLARTGDRLSPCSSSTPPCPACVSGRPTASWATAASSPPTCTSRSRTGR